MLAMRALFNQTGVSSVDVCSSGTIFWLEPQHVPCKYFDATSNEATKMR